MSFIKLEFSHDNELMRTSFQAGNRLTPSSSNVKIGKIDGKVFLNMFYRHKPITLKDKRGEIFQIDIEEILSCFINGEDEELYLIFDREDNLCAVWEYYDEEKIYRRYLVSNICVIHKFQMLIAAEEGLSIDAPSVINESDSRTVSGSEILYCYESMGDGQADDKSE